MTFPEIYARTIWRQPHRVCGEVLLPLTVGHARILESLELWNPANWIDLMICAWICGRPPGQFRQPRGWWEAFQWRIRLWRLSSQSFAEHLAAWSKYVDHHLEVPVLIWPDMGGTKSGSPVFANLRVALIRMGYSPDRVDDVPIDQAFLDHYGALENDGRVTVTGNSRSDLDKQLEAARAYVQSLGKN